MFLPDTFSACGVLLVHLWQAGEILPTRWPSFIPRVACWVPLWLDWLWGLCVFCTPHQRECSSDGVDGEGKEDIAKQLFSSSLFNFLRTHMCLTTAYLRGLALEKRSLQHGLVFSCLLVGKSRILTGARWEWLLGSSIQHTASATFSVEHCTWDGIKGLMLQVLWLHFAWTIVSEFFKIFFFF